MVVRVPDGWSRSDLASQLYAGASVPFHACMTLAFVRVGKTTA
jgi:hypothetical protein